MRRTFTRQPGLRLLFLLAANAVPLLAWAYQTLWVNKRIGALDPEARVPRADEPAQRPPDAPA
jgi:hypothetical protein